jgi:hypothetical protein
MKLAITMASGLGLGASGAGFDLLRQRKGPGGNRCGRQEKGRK